MYAIELLLLLLLLRIFQPETRTIFDTMQFTLYYNDWTTLGVEERAS